MASAITSAPTPAGANSVESLLSHVQQIEGDRARLLKELEDARTKIGRLSESKQAEMKQALDNMIMKMIKDSVQDPKVLEEFETGQSGLRLGRSLVPRHAHRVNPPTQCHMRVPVRSSHRSM